MPRPALHYHSAIRSWQVHFCGTLNDCLHIHCLPIDYLPSSSYHSTLFTQSLCQPVCSPVRPLILVIQNDYAVLIIFTQNGTCHLERFAFPMNTKMWYPSRQVHSVAPSVAHSVDPRQTSTASPQKSPFFVDLKENMIERLSNAIFSLKVWLDRCRFDLIPFSIFDFLPNFDRICIQPNLFICSWLWRQTLSSLPDLSFSILFEFFIQILFE